jgi:sterol desaturase/sphingolipid hydroxylase (fatty acid hydroxylase superfamily)
MHKNKWFWNNVHSHHHEKKNLNVYSTGYAVLLENFFLIAPPVMIVQFGYLFLAKEYNLMTMDLSMLAQTLIFTIGHSGFYQNYFLMVPASPGIVWGTIIRILTFGIVHPQETT